VGAVMKYLIFFGILIAGFFFARWAKGYLQRRAEQEKDDLEYQIQSILQRRSKGSERNRKITYGAILKEVQGEPKSVNRALKSLTRKGLCKADMTDKQTLYFYPRQGFVKLR